MTRAGGLVGRAGTLQVSRSGFESHPGSFFGEIATGGVRELLPCRSGSKSNGIPRRTSREKVNFVSKFRLSPQFSTRRFPKL